jgi:hypothetical protein
MYKLYLGVIFLKYEFRMKELEMGILELEEILVQGRLNKLGL